MEEIAVTWKHACKHWWSWFWRAMIWTIPVGMGLGFITGVVLAVAGIPFEPYALYLQLVGFLVGIYFSVYAMKVLLTKRFNGYRLALVRADSDSTDADHQAH